MTLAVASKTLCARTLRKRDEFLDTHPDHTRATPARKLHDFKLLQHVAQRALTIRGTPSLGIESIAEMHDVIDDGLVG